MTDQELELELNEAGTRLGDPPSSVDDLLGILDETSVSKGKNDKEQSGDSLPVVIGCLLPPDFEAKVAKLTELGFGRDACIIQQFVTQSGWFVVNPEAFQQQIRGDSNLMAQLLQSDPELGQAFLGNDLNRLRTMLKERHK
ncbi:hypothetical protein Syun_003748 [Stephania yunnanensis]|uniref:Uncharacterized protein n=1 Tax=Stephania yunnanensis TaxID=152371 RepID=A0AAP0L1U7_9MAGN